MEALDAARAFAAALAASDAEALARLASDRFSFDGDVRTGRETVRRTWHALLADRAGPPPAVGAVRLFAVDEAVAQYGTPPPRLTPLARSGALVAVCDVGGRTVVLFLAREAGRMAVLGMSD